MGRRPVRRWPGGTRVVLSRLFVALFPPQAVVRSLRAVLPAGAALTHPSKWHVTLVFLGEAPTDEVSSVLSGVAPRGNFSLRLSGGGRFGTAAWAGVTGDLEALASLQEGLRTLLSDSGFPSETRPYQPHLTVSYRGDGAMRRALAGYASSPWTVTEFALVESKDGDYLPVRSWPV
ncbi:RNA 2',3'-cyclic phosphodiesterase [Actinoplanes sp. KI2]|uniref:RNA 2',3'-cyclic phosphodiesterase n=1 Tax=Actinoplanes sp. KI2 TaxID=2983315 RepID=UPI0021D5A22B|nr:RNA 2',3'-cyclic phosphodiesterase [Actinoplanes sp. KI2]MCU7724211.1 RNA 2',3'-cyclic phosphodiesterase [Actinoplanes sp. KI2]